MFGLPKRQKIEQQKASTTAAPSLPPRETEAKAPSPKKLQTPKPHQSRCHQERSILRIRMKRRSKQLQQQQQQQERRNTLVLLQKSAIREG